MLPMLRSFSHPRSPLLLRSLGAHRRAFFVSTRCHADGPQAVHPSEHRPVGLGGQAVSDHAKEDETKRTGIPDEPSPGDAAILANKSAPQLFSLANRTVVLTGGARGLGLTIARSLLEAGASVAALDLLPEPAEPAWSEAQSLARSMGVRLTYDRLDVTDQGEVFATFKRLFDAAPADAPIRGIFTAAGITILKPAIDLTPEEIRRVMDINYTGSFLCAQGFAREYIARNAPGETSPSPSTGGRGDGTQIPGVEPATALAAEGGASIVMVGSISARVANYRLECTSYNTSKAAVTQLARNLAQEWGLKGIRINTLSPGYIRTAMTAALLETNPELEDMWVRGSLLGRVATPDEFRGAVIFLLSDASSFMTGSDLLVDGGHTAT